MNAGQHEHDFLNESGTFSNLSEIIDQAAKIIAPPPNRAADQWADDNRILPTGSAIPGPWNSDLVPFTRKICEAAASLKYKYVVHVTSSQNAKTETMLNIIGHRLTDGPFVPILIVEPTEKLVRSMSNDRFAKMIQTTPALDERLAKGQKDKVTEKFFAGIRIGFAWAGSATELASHPIGLLALDEVDRMPRDVGGEGDPVTIASARTTTFWNRKIFLASSPTERNNSPIWSWFLDGTRECWSWPCPNCNDYFLPQLRILKWPDKAPPEVAAVDSWVECPHCKHKIRDEHRLTMNEQGKYLRYMEDESGALVLDNVPRETNIASFWVSGLASPFVTFGESAEQFIRANQSHDQEKIKAVINTRFGELFEMEGQTVEQSLVESLIGVYAPKTWPTDAQIITGGIDVQRDGFYYTVRAWGWLSESWLIDYGFIRGNTDLDQVWLLLSRLVGEKYAGRPVRRWLIDAGYRPGDIWRVDQHNVKKFVLKHAGQVSAVFGRDALQNEPIITSEMKLDVRGQKASTGIPQFVIDTDHFKQWLFSHYQFPVDQPGAFHLHRDVTEGYLRSLVSEKMVLKATGKRAWLVRQGYENHYFDCEVYARVAAVIENVEHLRELKPKDAKPAEKQENTRRNPDEDEWLAGYN